MKNKFLIKIGMLGLMVTSFCFCNKENANADIQLAYQMISNKIWYLDYSTTTIGSGATTYTYTYQSTYTVNFLTNLTTADSDGLTGTYTITKDSTQLYLKVVAKTANNNPSNYTYNVVSLGAKDMVLSYTDGTKLLKYYYATHQ